jgi:serine/threonine-protein kinase RsbW/stage II sporulation protein AB (anti-sigma F factor)
VPVCSWNASAVAENVSVLRGSVADFAAANGVPEPRVGDVALAVSEAVTNAVVHAFRNRRPGAVRVAATVTPERGTLELTIDEDGSGLLPRDDSPGLGLGLALMRHLADEFDHRTPPGGGTEIWMSFRFSPLARSESRLATEPRSAWDRLAR